MRGWVTKTIGEACELVNGGTPKTGVGEFWGGQHQWVTPAEMGKRSSPYIDATERTLTDAGLANCSASPLPSHSVIMSSRAPIGHLVINTVPMSFNQGCKGLIPKPGLDHKFLYYFLLTNVELLNALGTGATFKELSGGKLKEVTLPIPPLAEQKRIIAILDEAFEGIAKATANAERNLANARELGESAIAAALSADDETWVTRRLEDCFRLKSGDNLTSSKMIEGGYPVYGGNGVAGSHNEFNLDGDNVIVGRVGALCGNARRIIEPIWLTDNAFRVADKKVELHNGFLTYLLNFKKLRSLARQSAQPVISNSSLRDLLLTFPAAIERQSLISDRLDAITETVSKLEEKYNDRSSRLDDLKASILRKAFSGHLTGKETIAA